VGRAAVAAREWARQPPPAATAPAWDTEGGRWTPAKRGDRRGDGADPATIGGWAGLERSRRRGAPRPRRQASARRRARVGGRSAHPRPLGPLRRRPRSPRARGRLRGEPQRPGAPWRPPVAPPHPCRPGPGLPARPPRPPRRPGRPLFSPRSSSRRRPAPVSTSSLQPDRAGERGATIAASVPSAW